MFVYAPQIPDSRPMLKQLKSELNETDRTDVGVDGLMGFRTFMMGVGADRSSPLRWLSRPR